MSTSGCVKRWTSLAASFAAIALKIRIPSTPISTPPNAACHQFVLSPAHKPSRKIRAGPISGTNDERPTHSPLSFSLAVSHSCMESPATISMGDFPRRNFTVAGDFLARSFAFSVKSSSSATSLNLHTALSRTSDHFITSFMARSFLRCSIFAASSKRFPLASMLRALLPCASIFSAKSTIIARDALSPTNIFDPRFLN